MRIPNTVAFVIALAVPQAAGIIGSLFTYESIESWYSTLAKPELAPPNWVFAPVWTTLFVLMGIAAFLVWRKGWARTDVRVALALFAGQLVLNTLWSILFFGLQSPGAALIEIAVLWCAIAATMVAFWRISNAAGWLLVPYLAWVSFATYLNAMLWILN